MTKQSIRNIDPDTFWDAKIYAVQTNQTIGQVITEALDLFLDEENTADIKDDDTAHLIAGAGY